jgi:hypothetical protein
MEMFLMVLCMSLFGLGVTAAAFGAATRPERPAEEPQPEKEIAVAPAGARFFADDAAPSPGFRTPVPVEALLYQIDAHIRLEQAAAESFMQSPNAALLHCRTISPLVH